MDRHIPSIPPNACCGQIDVDAAPVDAVREASSITYSGRAQRVSEGFAIALRAMGFGLPPSDIAQPGPTPTLEDR